MHQILGPSADDLLFSGDAVEDQVQVQKFLTAYDEKHTLTPLSDGEMSLSIGADDWPLPIPLVQEEKSQKWMFDTQAGKDEILNRRIGRNELSTMQTCLAYVDAQNEYAENWTPIIRGCPLMPRNSSAIAAREKWASIGKTKGWRKPPSPLGELAAEADSQGYSVTASSNQPRPYQGYLFRILKAQGPNAQEGGARLHDRHSNDCGFRLDCIPGRLWQLRRYATFIVNQDGVVYQRDLGPDTKKLASKIKAYDPDSAWQIASPTESEKPSTQAGK